MDEYGEEMPIEPAPFPVEDTTAAASLPETPVETFDQTYADDQLSTYQESSDLEWDAWRASVDAYVEGDQGLAYDLNQVSIDAAGVADEAWDTWNAEYQMPAADATPYATGDDAAAADGTGDYDTGSSDTGE